MSEKRFEVENERTVYDNLLHRGFVCSWKVDAQELVGLLNQLYEENEQLRQTNEKLEQECRQHLATNLRLLEQLNDFEEKISDKKLFKQKVTCDYKGDYVR